MNFAVSNISLPSFHHSLFFSQLKEMGFNGLEVAPSKVWENTNLISFKQVNDYRRSVEQAGLIITGLHSLFYDQPELGLFKGEIIRKKTLNFLIHLSKVCVDLGGKILIFGSPAARHKKTLSNKEADKDTISFFIELTDVIQSYGICFAIEALGESETDYIQTSRHAFNITQNVNCNGLKSHLDAKALTESGEDTFEMFQLLAPSLKHFHVNSPGLGILKNDGPVNHGRLAELLKQINYQGFISLEQKMIDPVDFMGPLKKSYNIMETYYGHG